MELSYVIIHSEDVIYEMILQVPRGDSSLDPRNPLHYLPPTKKICFCYVLEVDPCC